MIEKKTMPRILTGVVTSNKGDKTIVVLVERQVRHQKYEKYIKRSSKMHAHDESNECQIGDIVKIQETRPVSKLKTWKLVEIIRKVA